MAEANQSLRNAHAITLARYYAKRDVKAQWRAQGLKPQYIEHSELMRAANLAAARLRHIVRTAWSQKRYLRRPPT